MIRDVIKYFALFVVILVMILDAIAVLQVQLTVRDNASVAADKALAAYIDNASWAASVQVAESYVEEKGSRFVGASQSGASRRPEEVVTVTAERKSKTYVYHYFTKLPWGLGERVDNLLNPTATGDSR